MNATHEASGASRNEAANDGPIDADGRLLSRSILAVDGESSVSRSEAGHYPEGTQAETQTPVSTDQKEVNHGDRLQQDTAD